MAMQHTAASVRVANKACLAKNRSALGYLLQGLSAESGGPIVVTSIDALEVERFTKRG
jgi:hypothetical protein